MNTNSLYYFFFSKNKLSSIVDVGEHKFKLQWQYFDVFILCVICICLGRLGLDPCQNTIFNPF